MAAVRVKLGGARGAQTVGSPVRVRTGDSVQDAARQDFERDQKTATSSPLLGGVFVECVMPDIGETLKVSHRLKRKPQGWMVVRQLDSGVDLQDASDSKTDPNLTLELDRGPAASVDARFTLYVF